MQRNKELARKLARLIVRKVSADRASLVSSGELIYFLAQMYMKSRDFRNFIISPFVSKESKLSFLKALSQKAGAPQDIVDILGYLIDINGFSLLPEIKRLYEHEVEKIMRMSRGKLYLASELDSNYVQEIIDKLRKVLNREFEVEVEYDDKIIGGFVFRTPSFVIDASVKRQLESLLV